MSEDIASVGVTVLYEEAELFDDVSPGGGPGRSAVSWAAILAGATAGVATSLILLAVGAGMGLASVSPWANVGVSLTTFTVGTAIWLILMQWIASGLGGYVTGRLRTRWAGTHPHEVFFRDTAHGLLTWSVATLIAVVFVSSSALVTARGAASAVSAAAQATGETLQAPTDAFTYDVDTLFRSTRPDDGSVAQARAEATTILATSALAGSLPAEDRAYLVQLVVARTGIAPADARIRVDLVAAREQAMRLQAREAADAAREAGSKLSFFTALAMLIGAFIACVAAALGGQQRDEHP